MRKLRNKNLRHKTALLLGGGFACLFLPLSSASAQTDPNGVWVHDLPKPGYERRSLRFGNFTVQPNLDLSAIADSNVFATPTNREEDVLFLINPSAAINMRRGALTFNSELKGSLRRYLENTENNIETFGIENTAGIRFSSTQSASASVGFRRNYELRTDPDSNDDITLPPTLINVVDLGLGYNYRPGRFGVALRGSFSNPNFLEAEDDDRDMSVFRGSVRGLAGISSRIDFFTEGYAISRDFRTAVDRTGVNRDTFTIGVRSGIALNFTDQLEGDIGVGVFRASFDDDIFDAFTGVGLSGSIAWRPRTRTGIRLNVFRGDVATIAAGAQGRIDTTIGVNLTQEVRHNLILRASSAYRHRTLRNALNRRQEDFDAGAGLEYLLNRHVSVVADYSYLQRRANNFNDEFDIHRFGLTLKLRY